MVERGAVSCGENLYQICVEDYEGNGLSSDVLTRLSGQVRLLTVTLDRLAGDSSPSLHELMLLSDYVAKFVLSDATAVLVYFCDFINPITMRVTREPLSSQEYRSRLFSLLFKRYVESHRIDGYQETIVEITGIEESFFCHLIYRRDLIKHIEILASDLQEGFSK